jgi:hypothetical protein
MPLGHGGFAYSPVCAFHSIGPIFFPVAVVSAIGVSVLGQPDTMRTTASATTQTRHLPIWEAPDERLHFLHGYRK